MSTIAMDATYTVDREPSGVAVYSRKLIEHLTAIRTSHHFLICYRLSRFRQRNQFMDPDRDTTSDGSTFSVRLFQEPLTFWLPWQAELFHSLAQRPPAFHFKREIVTVHDIFPITGRDYSTDDFRKKFSKLIVEAVNRAACVIATSQYTARQLEQHVGVAGAKLRVIPEGVDPPAIQMTNGQRMAVREELVGKGNQMILNVGVIQTRKNTLNALRALESLPDSYHLVLVGGNGYGSEAAHEYIRKQGLEARVRILGHVAAERLPAIYQAADVFLFPSLEEGFGLPVLEAMSYRLPVVASRTSSLPEVGGDAAIYVDPQDPLDIAEKVRSVVEDQTLQDALIERGVERARAYSWRRTAEATLKVYEEVLGM